MPPKLTETAAVVGRDWIDGEYYREAEQYIASQWIDFIWPIIKDSDFSTTLELAAGHGRSTAKLLDHAQRVYAVDINQSNIDVLTERFRQDDKLKAIRNNGADLRMINGASVTFVYCFDAMVHFDSDVVRSYIKEFRRVMAPRARGFVHYSAYDKNPTGSYRDHSGWRNFMSMALFEHWLAKEGFRVLRSVYIARMRELTDRAEGADALTYFELPAEAEGLGAFRDPHEQVDDLQVALHAAQARVLTVEENEASQRKQIGELELQRDALETSSLWRVARSLRRLVRAIKGR